MWTIISLSWISSSVSFITFVFLFQSLSIFSSSFLASAKMNFAIELQLKCSEWIECVNIPKVRKRRRKLTKYCNYFDDRKLPRVFEIFYIFFPSNIHQLLCFAKKKIANNLSFRHSNNALSISVVHVNLPWVFWKRQKPFFSLYVLLFQSLSLFRSAVVTVVVVFEYV